MTYREAILYLAQRVGMDIKSGGGGGSGGYIKPATGIPESDLSADVQRKLNSGGGGGGVSQAMADSLWAIIKKSAFTEVLTDDEKEAFKTAWNISDDPEPVIDTSPRILAEDVAWTTSYTQAKVNGGCVTEFYPFTVDVDALKAAGSWDDAQNLPKFTGILYRIAYCIPNTRPISFGANGKIIVTNEAGTGYSYHSVTRGAESTVLSGKLAFPDADYKLSFTLSSDDVDDSYAYWKLYTTQNYTGTLPVGVNNGDIIFAGKNTKYYGMRNISEYEGE